MKKAYVNPETEVIMIDQAHIYTIISGASGDPISLEWSEFGFGSGSDT